MSQICEHTVCEDVFFLSRKGSLNSLFLFSNPGCKGPNKLLPRVATSLGIYNFPQSTCHK